ncbi:GGDEF domain-containing protein [Marinomonas ostreistagni]|nr:GGDEF domain-containing protein [Marinomonas ostreistagni]
MTLNAGAINHSFTNTSRRTFIINLFCLVGVLFTAPLGILSLLKGNLLVGVSLLCIATIYTLNHLYLRKTNNYLFSANVILYPLYTLMLYLVYSGGVNGTGHVWIYCIPPVSLFLHGLKRGLLEVFIFILALVYILFFISSPFDQLGYHHDLKSRIVYSFILIAFLSTIYEYISSRFNQSLQELSSKLELAATTDPLTNLLNRRGLEQQLKNKAWYKPSIFLLDIDHFKSINDKYGHEYGDEYLKLVARSMTGFLVGRECLLSRWGGEEFLLVVDLQNDHEKFAESVRNLIENASLKFDESHEISATVSIGISELGATETFLMAVGRADKALYEAKSRGRNCVVAAK